MEDIHLVHVLQPLTDLANEQNRVHLRQVVVLVDDAVKQLTALHTATNTQSIALRRCTVKSRVNQMGSCTHYSITRMMSWRDSKAA